ncbi:MAG: hypothetical protein ACNA8P_12005, partial [Phycisphaerales bacterium]
ALQRTTHGLDLTGFLSQPCLIITGEVVDACPTPFYVGTGANAREFEMTGRTVVRWIYPLEPDPLRVRGERADAPTGSATGSGRR